MKFGYLNNKISSDLEFKEAKDIDLTDYLGVKVLIWINYKLIPGIVIFNFIQNTVKVVDFDEDEWRVSEFSHIAKDTIGLGKKIIEQGLL